MFSIGIVAGAGPQAGAHFFNQLIQAIYSLGIGSESFPQIHLRSYPFRKVQLDGVDHSLKDKIKKDLNQCIEDLYMSGCDSVVVCCNTLHGFIEEPLFSDSRFISIVDLAYRKAKCLNDKMLVLSTQQTASMGLYSNLKDQGIKLSKEESYKLHSFITIGCDQSISSQHVNDFERFCYDLQNSYNVDSVILGCTELSVFFNYMKKSPFQVVIDPIALAIEKITQLFKKA